MNNPLKYSDPTGNNYYRDPATIGLSAHEQIYGPNSHLDELWRERFGLMYNDVFQTGGPNNSQPQESTEEIKLIDIFGNEVTFLIPKFSTITIDNTQEAFNHYFHGDGAPVTLGPSSISAIWNSEEFQLRHSRIVTGQTTRLYGNFGVNMEGLVFHIGETNVDYAINCSTSKCAVTYDLFVNDGFWDVNIFSESFFGMLKSKKVKPDGLGPNFEMSWGNPYPYIPIRLFVTFPNPGY